MDEEHSAAIKRTLDAKRARGERLGKIPYGKRLAADGVHLEDDPEEQATLTRMLELHREGVSLAKIATALGREGHKPRGRSWHKTTIARLVRSLQER